MYSLAFIYLLFIHAFNVYHIIIAKIMNLLPGIFDREVFNLKNIVQLLVG